MRGGHEGPDVLHLRRMNFRSQWLRTIDASARDAWMRRGHHRYSLATHLEKAVSMRFSEISVLRNGGKRSTVLARTKKDGGATIDDLRKAVTRQRPDARRALAVRIRLGMRD